MKKLIIGFVIIIFCFSLVPALAMDHNPYNSSGVSDKPGGDDDGWDHPKYKEHDDSGDKSDPPKEQLDRENEGSSFKSVLQLFLNIFAGKDGQKK